MAQLGTMSYENQRVLSVRVRVLHGLIVVLATIAAVAIALPSVLSQPTVYTTESVVRYDPAVFPDLVRDGSASAALQQQQENLGGVLQKLRYPSLRRYGLDYRYPEPGSIAVVSAALSSSEATAIANAAADGLARRIYTIEGLPLLREVLGHELQAALEGQPPQSREHELLRRLIQAQAVEGVEAIPGGMPIDSLSTQQRNAVARTLEVLEGQILFAERTAQDTLRSARATAEQRAQAQSVISRTPSRLVADRLLVRHLNETYRTNPELSSAAPAFVAQAASEASAIPNYTAAKLVIAGLVGFVGGLLTVLIDRQVGILRKLQELWNYRQLVRNMVARDLKARYKSSVLGYLWSLLNPLLMMAVFWIVFSVLLQSNIQMFPVFLIVALLPWNFAVTSVSGGMRAIIDNANLIKKVYFPREILPITVVLSNFVNYLFALPVMFLVMAGVQWATLGHLNFSWTFAFLPVIVAIQIIFLIGMVLLLSTMAVFFRDTTHIVDILIQLWIFLTPVFFSLEQIVSGPMAKVVRWVNPMASIVDFYRDILYGQATNPVPGLPALDGVFRTLLTALVVLALGSYVFHRFSGRFGEEI